MKKFIYILICLFVCSCQAQNSINSEESDVLIFSLLNNHDNSIKNIKQVYHNNDFFVMCRIRASYNFSIFYHQTNFKFVKEKDTMSVICYCGQNKNYYFKNLAFKKGKYELKIEYSLKYNKQTEKYEKQRKYAFGNEIKAPKELQNILFKNAYPWWEKNDDSKDIYFKDLKFVEIDIKDTINIKLKKLN